MNLVISFLIGLFIAVLMVSLVQTTVNDMLSGNVTANVTTVINSIPVVTETTQPLKDTLSPGIPSIIYLMPIMLLLFVGMQVAGLFTGRGRARLVERIRLVGDHSRRRNSRSTRFYFEEQASNLDKEIQASALGNSLTSEDSNDHRTSL
jgi:hypothetical protein